MQTAASIRVSRECVRSTLVAHILYGAYVKCDFNIYPTHAYLSSQYNTDVDSCPLRPHHDGIASILSPHRAAAGMWVIDRGREWRSTKGQWIIINALVLPSRQLHLLLLIKWRAWIYTFPFPHSHFLCWPWYFMVRGHDGTSLFIAQYWWWAVVYRRGEQKKTVFVSLRTTVRLWIHIDVPCWMNNVHDHHSWLTMVCGYV